MRIAYVVSRFPALSETFVVRELLELARRGHEVQVYALKSRSDPGYDPEAADLVASAEYAPFLLSARLVLANLRCMVRWPLAYWSTLFYVVLHSLVTPIECIKALGTYPKAILYGSLMARRGADHVHAHFANIPALAALVIHRVWGTPYSFVGHGLHDLFMFRSMLKEKVRHARFAVMISEYNRSYVSRHCDPADAGKMTVIHTGADVGRFAAVERQPEPNLLVTVARLSEEKGLDYMLEACALLRERGLAVRWQVGGEGAARPKLEGRIRELGLQEAVELKGAVPAGEVPDFIARGEVFVLPSLVEGLPVTLMEALAVGLPTVATNITGVPELIRHEQTGLVVEPRDPAGLADAVQRLLEDRDLAERLGRAGRRLVEEEFDLHRNAERLARRIEAAHGAARG